MSETKESHGGTSRHAVVGNRTGRLRWTARIARELNRVARQLRVFGRSPSSRTVDPEFLQLASRNAALTAESEHLREVIAHLRRVETAYCSALEAVEQHERLSSEVTRLAVRNSVLESDLAHTRDVVAHLRRVEIAYRAACEAVEQNEARASEVARLVVRNTALESDLERSKVAYIELDAARSGAQEFVNAWQRILFETGQTTEASRSAAILVSGNRPINESMETLINLSESEHGARPFQYILPFLATTQPFAEPWPDHMEPLRIVDVGSQPLTSEEDIYASLRGVAPTEVIGFDPFSQGERETPDGPTRVRRPDGAIILTYPHIVADGAPVTLHVNRYDPTSSIFPSNLALARQFGLLGAALETVETRNFASIRLDDLFAKVRVDLLKVDVQGAAHVVLANAPRLLTKALVCHVESEFAPIYEGEKLFSDVDILLRSAGFSFVDFHSLGRQRYARFEASPKRAFHRGRTLWADAIYIRGLDEPGMLTDDELFRAALIVHTCYNKQDLATELLGRVAARRENVAAIPKGKSVMNSVSN